MILPYPNDPSSFSQPNPLFNDNAFVRGDQFRANNQRIWANNDFLAQFLNYTMFGIAKGRLSVVASSPTVITLPVNNAYDVNSILQFVSSPESLDFRELTNIYRTDGVTEITNVSETQNKHLYLQLADDGTLSAMIIPNTDIANHNYGTNPKLLEAYYTGTPAIWFPLKNGYYRNSKRIIATLRLDVNNEIEFFYELDQGQRFQDVLGIAIGNTYKENRWTRCHPNCYLLDGSTITDMETESPLLYKILGSNVLPDFRDRFERNIDLATRSVRDLQTEMLRKHWHEFIHSLDDGNKSTDDPTDLLGLNAGNVYGTWSDDNNPNPVPNTAIIGDPTDAGILPVITGNETRPANFAVSIQVVRG